MSPHIKRRFKDGSEAEQLVAFGPWSWLGSPFRDSDAPDVNCKAARFIRRRNFWLRIVRPLIRPFIDDPLFLDA
jgi:hypothetical protein